MLLRLSPDEAMGRAAFALASVGVAFSGHVALGHAHCDYTQVILASLGLLFVSWRTRRTSHLFAGALIAQVIVHGGVPTQVHMIAIHLIAATLALGLMHHSEQLWHALSSILVPRLPQLSATPRAAHVVLLLAFRDFCTPAVLYNAVRLRGPPSFA